MYIYIYIYTYTYIYIYIYPTLWGRTASPIFSLSLRERSSSWQLLFLG